MGRAAHQRSGTAIGALWAPRPFILIATLPLLPGTTASSWEDGWAQDPVFKRVMRSMTLAWGCAFLIDAVTRIVKAYARRAATAPTRRIGGAR